MTLANKLAYHPLYINVRVGHGLQQDRLNLIVKCAQQGKRLKVKLNNLTTEEFPPLRKGDLKAGESHMADFNGLVTCVIY